MSKLKELRTAAGLTQKTLAEKLGTTQQTIARWETGPTPIPSETLKTLAALFGTSADELLGVEHRRPTRSAAGPSEVHRHEPWGTVSMDFPFGSRTYPLDFNARNFLVSFLNQEGALTGMPGWQSFDTLDGRCVFFNLALVKRLRFLGPKVDYPISPNQLRGPRPSDEHAEPQEVQSNICVLDADGTTDEFPLSDAVRKHLTLFDDWLHKAEANVFLPVREDGDEVQILNLNTVATIEVPSAAYYARHDEPKVDGA